MKPSRTVTLVATLMLFFSLGGSVLSLRRVDQVRSEATLREVLYISSPKALKRLSLGYSGLLADIYWTRAVQYFGLKHHEGTGHYALLGPLLEITTGLDPQLLVAYEYGSNFLAAEPPLGAGQPEQAAQLVRYGIQNNPQDWRLYYDLGFIDYLGLKDYHAAAEAFEEGSKLPRAHPFMKVMAAQMATHAGDLQMAGLLWTTTYQSTTDRQIRANAAAHLRAIQVDEAVTALDQIVKRYELKTGKTPGSFMELVAAGMIPGVPLDPLRHPYKLASGGRVEVSDPDNFPFIHKGLPLGYSPPAKPKFLPTD
jgi:hypothetical protein